MFSNHTEPRKALHAGRPKAYFHPPPTCRRIFWSLVKAITRDFRPSNSHHNCNSFGVLTCEPHKKAEVFASRFVFDSTLPNYSMPQLSFSFTAPLFLPPDSIRMNHQALHSLNVCKPPDPDDILPIFFKNMCSRGDPSFTSSVLPYS